MKETINQKVKRIAEKFFTSKIKKYIKANELVKIVKPANRKKRKKRRGKGGATA